MLKQRLHRLEKAAMERPQHPLAGMTDDELLRVVCAACDAPVSVWCNCMNSKTDPRDFLREYGNAESQTLFLDNAKGD